MVDRCELTLNECKKLDDAIGSLFGAAGYLLSGELYYKDRRTGELIKYDSTDVWNTLSDIKKAQDDLKRLFGECGCVSEPVTGGLGALFGETIIKTKR